MSKLDLRAEDLVEIWQPHAFDAPIHSKNPEDDQEPVILPTAEEVEAMQEMARQEGRQQGYEEGYHAGYREGFSDGELQRKTLTQMAENFQNELSRLDDVVAAELTTLALSIARRVLTIAYDQDAQLVAKMVEHAIQALPGNLEPTRVLVHPEDLKAVENHLSEEFAGRHLTFIPDETISRGGLKLMTATTDIDATFETRWQRVTSVLDQIEWEPLSSRIERSTSSLTSASAKETRTELDLSENTELSQLDSAETIDTAILEEVESP